MPGTGTKQDITKSNAVPPARLLDLTRLASRAGRHLTGVDRVEFAYARALSAAPEPCFGLVRTGLGYILVAPDMLWPVVQRICNGKRCAPDLLSRLSRGKTRAQREAETEFRQAAQARCRHSRLADMLKKALPLGFAYLNVGHSNLNGSVLSAVHTAGGRNTVMVHDVIPIEFPEFQRDGTPQHFVGKIQSVRSGADLLIYNSHDTQTRAERAMTQWGAVPPGAVAMLGTEPVGGAGGGTSNVDIPKESYFVVVGTIEPRKNIGFLLDIWAEMGEDAPLLLVVGARGWKNQDVFDRLDAMDRAHPKSRVHEYGNVNDADLAALVAASRGLLFPSHAEGFGLPAVESAQMGVPVLCNTLPVFEELLGDIPIYASVKDPYLWIKQVKFLADSAPDRTPKTTLNHLTWDAHFKTVLSIT